MRKLLYAAARLLGDLSAISSGSPTKIAKRAVRKSAYKSFGKGMNRLLK